MLVSANGTWHWSGFGAILLILLFVGSTKFTEEISCSKYPEYDEWQKATPSIVPFLTAVFRRKNRKIFWKSLQ